MRAVRFHEHGGADVLQVDDVEAPDPGPGEVVVDVEAVGVNPVDTYFREGAYPVPSLPFVPGSDLAGTVAAVGDRVDRFAAGDRVFGTGLGNGMSGTYAERVAAPADFLATLPEDASFVDAAALGLVGMTAWQAFVRHARVEPAERVLVHGGSGGVGHVAVQLATAMGARVTATASRDHHDAVRDLGADAVLDYAIGDLETAVVEQGAPEVVLDTRMDEYFALDAEVAAQGARIVGIGNETEAATIEPLAAAKGKELRYQFMSMFNTDDKAAVLDHLGSLLADGQIAPVVHRRYGLEEAAEAQRAVLSESFVGKLVLEP